MIKKKADTKNHTLAEKNPRQREIDSARIGKGIQAEDRLSN